MRTPPGDHRNLQQHHQDGQQQQQQQYNGNEPAPFAVRGASLGGGLLAGAVAAPPPPDDDGPLPPPPPDDPDMITPPRHHGHGLAVAQAARDDPNSGLSSGRQKRAVSAKTVKSPAKTGYNNYDFSEVSGADDEGPHGPISGDDALARRRTANAAAAGRGLSSPVGNGSNDPYAIDNGLSIDAAIASPPRGSRVSLTAASTISPNSTTSSGTPAKRPPPAARFGGSMRNVNAHTPSSSDAASPSGVTFADPPPPNNAAPPPLLSTRQASRRDLQLPPSPTAAAVAAAIISTGTASSPNTPHHGSGQPRGFGASSSTGGGSDSRGVTFVDAGNPSAPRPALDDAYKSVLARRSSLRGLSVDHGSDDELELELN
jgi:hypothetical protein